MITLRFPKDRDPVIESTKADRRCLAEAARLLFTMTLVPGHDSCQDAGETILAILKELEPKRTPVSEPLPFDAEP